MVSPANVRSETCSEPCFGSVQTLSPDVPKGWVITTWLGTRLQQRGNWARCHRRTTSVEDAIGHVDSASAHATFVQCRLVAFVMVLWPVNWVFILRDWSTVVVQGKMTGSRAWLFTAPRNNIS